MFRRSYEIHIVSVWSLICPLLRLEPLQSQHQLITMIGEAIQGMAATRKALQDLGKTPSEDDVASCLRTAAYSVFPKRTYPAGVEGP